MICGFMEVNKILVGDCIEKMKELPDNSIDLILIDPPYNISRLNDQRDRSKLNSPIMRRKKALNYDFGEERSSHGWLLVVFVLVGWALLVYFSIQRNGLGF